MKDGPQISGKRINLRPLGLSDLPFLESLWNGGLSCLGFPGGVGISREGMREWWHKSASRPATHLVIENEDGTPIGECGWGLGGIPGRLDLKLAPAFLGQGYAGETLEALLAFIWQDTALERVYFHKAPENRAATRLLEEFGFEEDPFPDDIKSWSLARSLPVHRPSVLIFDWGGVLMRTVDGSFRRWWETELGLPAGGIDAAVFDSRAWQQAQLGNWSVERCWSAIGESLGLEPGRLAQFRHDFWAGDQLDTVLIERIASWIDTGRRIALLSNHNLELEDRLDENGVRRLFDPIVISAREGIMKPGARIYWRICNRLNIPPARALFIDDSMQNIQGAQIVGLHTHHFQSTQLAIDTIEAEIA